MVCPPTLTLPALTFDSALKGSNLPPFAASPALSDLSGALLSCEAFSGASAFPD
jgi:hypothetical protein